MNDDAVARDERARGPEQDVLPPRGDADLEHRARRERDEDLRDRDAEVERHLSEDLQREDDRREVQARVAELGEEDRVRAPAECQRRAAGGRGGGSRHAVILGSTAGSPLDPGRVS